MKMKMKMKYTVLLLYIYLYIYYIGKNVIISISYKGKKLCNNIK